MALDPAKFPKLTTYNETSPEDTQYNCLAYAWGFTDRWACPKRWWPQGFRRNLSVKVVESIFASHGYQPCANGDVEAGVEKIAIYAHSGEAQHAACQLESGEWTSKMGGWNDITHPDTQCLEGPWYGKVVAYMKRPRKAARL